MIAISYQNAPIREITLTAPADPSAPQIKPETTVLVEEETTTRISEPWKVILFNDDIHTFEEVIHQIVKATACSTSEAEGHAWRVHLKGKTCVFDGVFEKCLGVQGVLCEIALVTEIRG